jgi:hypothetical protein
MKIVNFTGKGSEEVSSKGVTVYHNENDKLISISYYQHQTFGEVNMNMIGFFDNSKEVYEDLKSVVETKQDRSLQLYCDVTAKNLGEKELRQTFFDQLSDEYKSKINADTLKRPYGLYFYKDKDGSIKEYKYDSQRVMYITDGIEYIDVDTDFSQYYKAIDSISDNFTREQILSMKDAARRNAITTKLAESNIDYINFMIEYNEWDAVYDMKLYKLKPYKGYQFCIPPSIRGIKIKK